VVAAGGDRLSVVWVEIFLFFVSSIYDDVQVITYLWVVDSMFVMMVHDSYLCPEEVDVPMVMMDVVVLVVVLVNDDKDDDDGGNYPEIGGKTGGYYHIEMVVRHNLEVVFVDM